MSTSAIPLPNSEAANRTSRLNAVLANPGLSDQLKKDIQATLQERDTLTGLVARSYDVLAEISHDWPGRATAMGQGLLINLNTAISLATGRSPRDVQDDARCPFVRTAVADRLVKY